MIRCSSLVAFLHIPRTGGTTLRWSIMSQFYETEQIYHVASDRLADSLDAFIQGRQQQYSRVRLIHGHMGFGLHTRLKEPITYLTLLRHPIDLHISNYFYITTKPDHPSYVSLRSQAPTFEDYVRSALNQHLMVRRLCSLDGIFLRGDEPVGLEHLKRAQQHLLENVDLLGLTDRFGESVQRFRQKLGWPDVHFEALNSTAGRRPERERFPEPLLDQIRERCSLDVALYEYACTLFDSYQ